MLMHGDGYLRCTQSWRELHVNEHGRSGSCGLTAGEWEAGSAVNEEKDEQEEDGEPGGGEQAECSTAEGGAQCDYV